MAESARIAKEVPQNINEEYYQISGEILSSFPKYRPPVDLFSFREDIMVLAPYCKKETRLRKAGFPACAAPAFFCKNVTFMLYFYHKSLFLVKMICTDFSK